MVKEEQCCGSGCCAGSKGGIMIAALLLAIGMIVGAYLLAQGDYAPNVNVANQPSNPNVYVSSTPPEHVISTSATATEKVAPDLLQIQIRVQTEAANAKDSQADNADVMADLRAKLKNEGVKDEDIQTVQYSVDPIYDSNYMCDRDGYNCHYDSKLTGYRTTQVLSVELSDLDKGGDVIDAAASAGTNQTFVDYVSFTLKDETRSEVVKDLLKEASEEAKSKAQNMASGLGVSLGKPLSASESTYYPYYSNYKTYAAYDSEMAAGAPTVLSEGQIEVSATVSVGYEIGS
ncbi:SIMPL domain-containing protein [Candidatus Micrarchaeota archaeon]|nr:SIMPL domain-containing protein [Candidatus Micrarchaeota archaeon]